MNLRQYEVEVGPYNQNPPAHWEATRDIAWKSAYVMNGLHLTIVEELHLSNQQMSEAFATILKEKGDIPKRSYGIKLYLRMKDINTGEMNRLIVYRYFDTDEMDADFTKDYIDVAKDEFMVFNPVAHTRKVKTGRHSHNLNKWTNKK